MLRGHVVRSDRRHAPFQKELHLLIPCRVLHSSGEVRGRRGVRLRRGKHRGVFLAHRETERSSKW